MLNFPVWKGLIVYDPDIAENPHALYALYCTGITQRLDFLNSFLRISTLTPTWLWCYLMLTEWWELFIESGWRSQAWYAQHMRWSDREIQPSPCRPWLQMNHVFTMWRKAWIKCHRHPEAFPSISHGSQTNHPIITANTRSHAGYVHFSIVTACPLWNMLDKYSSLVLFRTWFCFEVTYISFLLNGNQFSSCLPSAPCGSRLCSSVQHAGVIEKYLHLRNSLTQNKSARPRSDYRFNSSSLRISRGSPCNIMTVVPWFDESVILCTDGAVLMLKE